ncbi:hypothetical protein IF2G_03656 [Cordyceps javanica]|nr:hypothetical protein IF2G_03656 [Cordyceps javanica]
MTRTKCFEQVGMDPLGKFTIGKGMLKVTRLRERVYILLYALLCSCRLAPSDFILDLFFCLF